MSSYVPCRPDLGPMQLPVNFHTLDDSPFTGELIGSCKIGACCKGAWVCCSGRVDGKFTVDLSCSALAIGSGSCQAGSKTSKWSSGAFPVAGGTMESIMEDGSGGAAAGGAAGGATAAAASTADPPCIASASSGSQLFGMMPLPSCISGADILEQFLGVD